ncbi:MAG: hypothetical protein LBC25_00160, partial [Holosporales bacterium]|nr:hypothetical protein [Holosporales bacterium]
KRRRGYGVITEVGKEMKKLTFRAYYIAILIVVLLVQYLYCAFKMGSFSMSTDPGTLSISVIMSRVTWG